MITPRDSPEVATYNNYLLAAGGEGDGGKLTTVEVLDARDGRQWLTVTQLPVPCDLKTSAIIHNNWYVITSTKEVMHCSLPDMCSQTASKSAASDTPARWQRAAESNGGGSSQRRVSETLPSCGCVGSGGLVNRL